VDWLLLLNWTVQGLILAGFAFVGVYVGLRLFTRGRGGSPSAETPAPSRSGRPATAPESLVASAPPLPGRHGPSSAVENIRHAFEIEGDRVTVMVELPLAWLHDDRMVVDAWLEAIGAARSGEASVSARSPVPAGAVADEQEQLQIQLNTVLNRLQLAAERRRRLRAMLEERFPVEET
jgi:hypothetical protein